MRLFRVAAIALALGSAGAAEGALTFNFTKGSGITTLEGGTPTQQQTAANVVAGFQMAGNLWSNIFNDNITINIQIDYLSLGAGILGSTSTITVGDSYSDVAIKLASDITSSDDVTAVANLPVGPTIPHFRNMRNGTKYFDNDASGNNTVLDISRANAKAFGLVAANDASQDSSITFSSNFSFDFDRSNGINGSQFDFVGVAAHEIGHAMGFVSGVDVIDSFTGSGPNAGADLNMGASGIGELDPFRIYGPIDLFRYSATSIAQGPRILDLATGGTPFFSINAGVTNLGTFSTGISNGDGRQASHWKDNLTLGIMDPTLANGEFAVIRPLDIQAMDVIGFNRWTPEPSSVGLILFVGGWLTRRGARRRITHG